MLTDSIKNFSTLGSVLALPSPQTEVIMWSVLAKDDAAPDRLYIAPMDSHPLERAVDMEMGARSEFPHMCIRPDYGLWVQESTLRFIGAKGIGQIEEEHIAQVRSVLLDGPIDSWTGASVVEELDFDECIQPILIIRCAISQAQMTASILACKNSHLNDPFYNHCTVDTDVEKLLEGTAFLSKRIHSRLGEEFPDLFLSSPLAPFLTTNFDTEKSYLQQVGGTRFLEHHLESTQCFIMHDMITYYLLNINMLRALFGRTLTRHVVSDSIEPCDVANHLFALSCGQIYQVLSHLHDPSWNTFSGVNTNDIKSALNMSIEGYQETLRFLGAISSFEYDRDAARVRLAKNTCAAACDTAALIFTSITEKGDAALSQKIISIIQGWDFPRKSGRKASL